jgi:arylsulfatase A-like enzyme
MRFTNAFVVSSLCSPSRAAILTGKYNHINGIINNETEFHGSTFIQKLKHRGYLTGYFGKWHMGSQSGPVKGFDIFKSFINQGTYYDCEFSLDGSFETLNGWVDDRTTDLVIDFLKDNYNNPFCCIIGFKSPHSPWSNPPPRVQKIYDNYTISDPKNLNFQPIYESNIQYTAEEYKSTFSKYDLKYFEIITAMDQNIGRLLNELTTLNIDENTVVIFMSDNGLYLGEHGLRDKRSAYEESIRIPLIIKFPSLIPPNSVNNKMVLNIDIAPTVLDMAGLNINNDIQGNSLMPLFNGEEHNWRTSFYYEYFEEPMYGPPISIFAVRKEDAKLIKYLGHDNWTELYDLKNDPFETSNLYQDSNYKNLLTIMENEFRLISNEVYSDYLLKWLGNE